MVFRLLIVKLTAVCNLNCSYCYVFNLKDQTHSRVNRHMAVETSLKVLERVHEHVEQHNLESFTLSLHGGEPTMWSTASFQRFLEEVVRLREGGINLKIGLQTNAYFWKPRLLELLDTSGVTIGVSIDGPRRWHDDVRVRHNGSGSYDRVIDNVHWLSRSSQSRMLDGFLSVANPEVSPAEYLDWASKLPVTRLDILWPLQYNWNNPPWPTGSEAQYASRPKFGIWFATLFQLWLERDDPSLQIRGFVDLIQVMLGGRSHSDSLVNDKVEIAVVNTDGAYEYHDYLRGSADGACRSGLNIANNSLDEIARESTFDFLMHLGDHLPSECFGCGFVATCGGGHLAGRPDGLHKLPIRKSVLCYDQYYFFHAAANLLRERLPSGSLAVDRLNHALLQSQPWASSVSEP